MHPLRFVQITALAGSIGLLTIAPTTAWADLWGASVDFNMTAPMGTEDQYDRVFRFDTSGNKISGDIPHMSAGLSLPGGMAVSPAGEIYVSGIGIGSILKYDGQTGSPLGLFATLSEPPGAPAQLAFGPDGNLYVSEFFGTSVRVFDTDTATELVDQRVEGLTSAGGLAFGPDGDLYIGDGFAMSEEDSARVVRVHDGVVSTFGETDGGMLSSPTALEFLPNGNLLVVDVLGNYVAQFDSNGENFQPFAVMPPDIPANWPEIATSPTNSPSDIDYDQDGNLVVSLLGLTNPPDHRGALLRFAIDGTPLAPLAENLEPISVIVWTPSANTLAGDYDGNGTVEPADYTKWQDDFGKRVARGNGADGNNDGWVDAADYTVWRDGLGNTLGEASVAGGAIPEPGSLAIAVCCLSFVARVRMNRHGTN
jgi:sugar lactone lactonase YvrE